MFSLRRSPFTVRFFKANIKFIYNNTSFNLYTDACVVCKMSLTTFLNTGNGQCYMMSCLFLFHPVSVSFVFCFTIKPPLPPPPPSSAARENEDAVLIGALHDIELVKAGVVVELIWYPVG